jgi:hypothetical protein
VAQQVQIILTSDLSGGAADETVSFMLDGTQYELDVTSKEADKFRGLFQDYIAVARKVSGGRKAAKRTTDGPSAKDVKAWADTQGLDYPQRGRLPKELLDMYKAAN